jgi:thiamine-monophosphate kinase
MTSPPPGLSEFGRIERYFRPLAASMPGALSLTDDAASLRVPRGDELVVTTDAIVGGVHFLPDDEPVDIARKALRVNLSDLAAKGARPLAYTLTLALPRDAPDSWVAGFAGGLAEDQARYGIALIGGDSVSTPGPVCVSITAFGLVPAGRMVRRRGAEPGDIVLVTGTIGDAALGLMALRGDLSLASDDAATLARRYRLPEPRSALAKALLADAHAALDVSDGLAADFGHLCDASGVRGVIDAPRIPLSPAAGRVVASHPRLMTAIFGGGDDYELVMTASAAGAGALAAAASAAGIRLTEIGRVETGAGAVLNGADGREIALESRGWVHA